MWREHAVAVNRASDQLSGTTVMVKEMTDTQFHSAFRRKTPGNISQPTGRNPRESFRVICDESNNSTDTINAGQVIIDVAIAPTKPAEFVRFRFTQLSA